LASASKLRVPCALDRLRERVEERHARKAAAARRTRRHRKGRRR
jgi:hypothetical protein